MQSCPHIAVSDFEQGVGFYTAMFGLEPTVRTERFASWRSRDSRISFAIIARRSMSGESVAEASPETSGRFAAEETA